MTPADGAVSPTIITAGDQATGMASTRAEEPPAEVLAEVLDRYAQFDRAHQAWHLVVKMRRRGIVFRLRPDGKVQPLCPTPDVEPPSDREWSVLKWLKPEIVALLRKEQAPAEAKSEAVAGPNKPAPRVKDPAEIRGLIGRLRGAPDDSLSRALAARLAGPTGFRDRDQETSRQTYYGLFEDLRLGRGYVSEDCLHQGFEAACGRKCRNRGAVFIARVGDWLGERRARRGQSRAP